MHRYTSALLAIVATSLTAATAPAAPDGFETEVFSDKVQNATAMCFDDTGRLYVTETFRFRRGAEDNRDHKYWIMEDLATDTTEGRVAYLKKYAVEKIGDPDYFTKQSERVVLLDDPDGDGKADAPTVFADGFNAVEDGPAIGLLADEGRILMASVPHIWELQDKDGDGVSEARSKLISGLGIKTSLSGHDLHGLVWGPDGKLYFSLGDRGYNVTTKEGAVLKNTNSGAVFRCDPDGANLEIFYLNLRNPQEIAFNEFGDLFTVDNNCDQGDQARVCYLIEGGDAGWSIGGQSLTTYKASIKDGGMGQRPHWLTEGVWKMRHEGSPQYHLPPIAYLTNGPSGMCFDSGTSMPERYRNHFLVCDYKGSPNRCFLYSFKVKRDGAGYAMEDAHKFHSGVANTDVEIGYDGKIYLADFGGGWHPTDKGNIYTIHDPAGVKNPAVLQTEQLFQKGFPSDVDALFKLLEHPDMRVRQRAQLTIAKAGDEHIDRLSILAHQSLHAIWALRQIGASEALHTLFGNADPEIRAQAARALGDLRYAPASGHIIAAINDTTSPRLRSFATIAAGKLGDRSAIPAVVAMLLKNDNKDLTERHAGIYALERLIDDADITALKSHQSPAIRLAVCIALRRQLNPRVAEFLTDTEPTIAAAAIRACNDLDIPGTTEVLAEFSKRYIEGGHDVAPLSEILFRRLINANVRAGKPEHAAHLVALAANSKLPEPHRLLCLKALETFAAPEPIDSTLGIYRPLASRDDAAIRAAIQQPLLALFKTSTGNIAAGVTRLVSIYELDLDPKTLAKRILDSTHPTELRKAALERLAVDPKFTDSAIFLSALSDPAATVRATAVAVWAYRYPERAIEGIDTILARESNIDKRAAYSLLAAMPSPEADARLTAGLAAIKAGTLPRGLHLDLYEAAAKHGGAMVKTKLAEIDSWLQKDGRTAFHFTIAGGDPNRGREVFANQGLCMKCHKADNLGGDAGPPLNTIATLRKSDEILHSLLTPNALVVPGYGIATITLNDGTAITGSPISESAESLVIKSASGEQQSFALSDIAARSPEVSAMPPMISTGIISKQDTRDLMAYLMSLTEQK